MCDRQYFGGSRYRIETTATDGTGTGVLEGGAVVLVDELPPGADDYGRAPTGA